MAFDLQAFIKGLQDASQGGKTTEIFNALKDWRPAIDSSKLSSLSNDQLVSIWNEGTGARENVKGMTDRQRKKIISNINDQLIKTQKLISRSLKDAINNPSKQGELLKNAESLFKFAGSLEKGGLMSKPLEEQLKPLMGSNFDAIAYGQKDLNTPTATPPAPPPPTGASNIPFKAGLSDAQKSGIEQLATKSPDQWSATDKANWNYATNNAPVPASGSSSAVPPPTSPAPTSGPAPAPAPSPSPSGTPAPAGSTDTANAPVTGFDINSVQWRAGITDAQKKQFADLMTKRPPDQWTDADKANWAYATNNAPVPTAGAGGVMGAPPPDDMIANLKALGLSDETIAALPPDQRGIFASIGAVMQKQIDNGNPLPQTFTTDDLARFADQAAKDPTIDKYYKDQLRLGVADLNAKLGFLTGDTQEQFRQMQQQFPQQDIQAAKAAAEAGQAYSGFRNQAKERLKSNQQAVLQSTTRQAQQNLRSLGSSFEQTFGTKNLPQNGLNISGLPSNISYNAFGNVPGQLEQQKQTDIANKNQSLIADASLLRGLGT